MPLDVMEGSDTVRHIFIFLLMVMLSPISWGSDFAKGLDTYEKEDFATALREWTPLAEQGDAGLQYFVGMMYQEGVFGVLQDHKTAVKWYTLSARQGYANAQYNLGWMYHQGQGVLQDYKAAVKWYTLAAEQGDASAQYNLGWMYYLGKGVIKDYVYSHMWLNIASSNSAEKAGELRDVLAKDLTPQQLERAQQLARECVAKDYKGC